MCKTFEEGLELIDFHQRLIASCEDEMKDVSCKQEREDIEEDIARYNRIIQRIQGYMQRTYVDKLYS